MVAGSNPAGGTNMKLSYIYFGFAIFLVGILLGKFILSDAISKEDYFIAQKNCTDISSKYSKGQFGDFLKSHIVIYSKDLNTCVAEYEFASGMSRIEDLLTGRILARSYSGIEVYNKVKKDIFGK